MFTINQDIIDIVISDILFNIDDEEFAPTSEKVLLIFKLFEDANNNQVRLNRKEELNYKAYNMEINFLQLFFLVIHFISFEPHSK